MSEYQLLPNLSDEDYARLRADIAERGVMVPIEVDEDGNILDGHHRMRIADELGIHCPKIVRKDMAEWDKRIHAVMLNLARRQLTDYQTAEVLRDIKPDIAARAAARMAQAEGQQRGVKASAMDKCPDETQMSTTRDELAALGGVGSGRTLERHWDTIDEAREMAEDSPDIAELLDKAERGEADLPDIRKAMKPHVANNSGENEWYTPPQYIEAARACMGGIDLDPASSETAQENVGAKSYYTKDDDGLAHDWHGRVWMNPPYSNPEIKMFSHKLVDEIDAGRIRSAVVLVNNATETQWGQLLLDYCEAACFPSGRIKYLDATNQPKMTPLQGQMFLYFGDDVESFRKNFSEFGVVL